MFPLPTPTGRCFAVVVAALLLGGCAGQSDDAVPPLRPHAVRLEFKEQRDALSDEERASDAAHNAAQYAAAQRARMETPPESFVERAERSQYSGRGGYSVDKFRDEVPSDLRELLFDALTPGAVSDAREVPLEVEGKTHLAGYSIVQLLKREEVRRDIRAPATATVTHLLVAYAGAVQAAPTVTRSKKEAKTLAADLLARAREDEDFTKLIAEYSDDASKSDNGGTFKAQVIGEADPTKNAFVKEFNDAVVAAKQGELTGPVETAFGFHVIRVDEKTERVEGVESQPRVTYAEWFFPARVEGDWRDTGLNDQMVVKAEGQQMGDAYSVVVTFNREGARLFRTITKRNVGKPVGIFLDGYLISSPVVEDEISGGEAVISGNFTADEAAALARDIMAAP